MVIKQNNLELINLDIEAFEMAIEKKVRLERYTSLFNPENPPCSTYIVNPCGLVPKKDTYPTEYRVINHQSTPAGRSVNDGIDKADFTTTYENMPFATRWIRTLGAGTQMIKVDIKEVYQVILIHLVDQTLQGVMYKD